MYLQILHNVLCAKPLSCVQLFAALGTVACQAPLSMGFSWQEYWSSLPFPPPGDLPDSGTEPTSPMSPALAVDSLPLCLLGIPTCIICVYIYIYIYIYLCLHLLSFSELLIQTYSVSIFSTQLIWHFFVEQWIKEQFSENGKVKDAFDRDCGKDKNVMEKREGKKC